MTADEQRRAGWSVELAEDEGNTRYDWRYTIQITDGSETREYFDKGEPEDNSFYRDYDWIVPELQKAHDAGYRAGETAAGTRWHETLERGLEQARRECRAEIVAWLRTKAKDDGILAEWREAWNEAADQLAAREPETAQ
jgi:hypothetical protein